jgi:capsular exopolysaccharide synthesis family protein
MSSEKDERDLPDSAAKASGLNHRLVLQAIRRRPLRSLAVVAFAITMALAVWFFLPLPKVTAAVVFQVATQRPRLLDSDGPDGDAPFASYRASQASLVKSHATLNATLRQPGILDLKVIRTATPDPLSWLDRKLTVDSKSGTEFMRVTIEGEDPEELMAVLRALAKCYLDQVDERDNGARKQKLKKLEESQQGYRKEVTDSQSKIDDVARSLGSKDGPTLAAIDTFHKDDLRRTAFDLNVLKDQHALAVRELAAWEAANKAGVPPVIIAEATVERELKQDRTLTDLDAAWAKAMEDVAKARKDFDEGSAVVMRAREKVEEAKTKRDRYRTEIRQTILTRLQESAQQTERGRGEVLEKQVESLAQRVQVARDRFETTKQDIAKLNERRIELENLKRVIEHNEKLSSTMAQGIERLKVELGAPPRVSMLEEPHTLTGIEGNRRLKFSLMACIGALGFGFVGLVGWEYTSRRVTHSDEVSQAIGVRLLGTVPPNFEPGTTRAAFARLALVESIDTIRTLLLHCGGGNPAPRTILITSPDSGEGKTSLSGHLAISLARAGFRTLLVDGDLQSPSAHALFNLPHSPGLCEVLRGEIELTEALRESLLPGLAILPAGNVDLSARQSLVGARWRQIRHELEGRFDFLVIDTAPLLLISDTLLLAREADGVVLSVMVGVSRLTRLAETEGRLRAIGARLSGVVVHGQWEEAHYASSRYGTAADRLPPHPTVPKNAPG